ncbi:MAG: type II toxin-antitoxin system HicA family toxin [Patescibacteria group bacterium]
MPRLPTLTPRIIIGILLEHGFVLDRTSGSHNIYFHPLAKKRVTVPMHTKDLPKGTLLSIIRQAGISKADLI